jgi:ferredoxin
MHKVRFKGKVSGEVEMEQEASLLSAATRAKLTLTHRCGGHARCGTCRVTIEEGAEHLSPVGGAEARVLKILTAEEGQRLACQAWATGDVCCRVD